jgi:glycosyltransferase involved in cell wall biosynthesis
MDFDKTKVILSIIIPTKNRSATAIYAIKSVLKIEANNYEIIVQDCSDNNELENFIFTEFENESKIKYFYSNDFPSLTENWNRAIYNSCGEYICGIGDDDAIFKYCYDVTLWMKENSIDSVLPLHITYIWPDAYLGKYSNSRLSIPNHITGKIYKVDLKKEFESKIINCGFGYTENLPNIYHGIVKRDILQNHKISSGHYLSGTSFDVYNSFVLGKKSLNLYFIDYPLTLRGISGKSNGNRIITKKSHLHFQEFNKVIFPQQLPEIYTSETSITESLIVALNDLNIYNEYIDKINFSVVYGKITALDPKNFLKYFIKFMYIKNSKAYNFFKFTFIFSKYSFTYSIKNKIATILNRYFPFLMKLIEKKNKRYRPTCENILNAIDIIENKLLIGSIEIKFEENSEILISKKEIWQ